MPSFGGRAQSEIKSEQYFQAKYEARTCNFSNYTNCIDCLSTELLGQYCAFNALCNLFCSLIKPVCLSGLDTNFFSRYPAGTPDFKI